MKVLLLILLAMALVIAPLSMLRPTPEQRRREQLRLAARQLGLRFAMRALPQLKTDMDAPRPMPCYFLPPPAANQLTKADEWFLTRTAYAHEGNFYREWDWLGESRPTGELQAWLHQQMASLPEGVRSLSYGPAGISAYWAEKEGQEALEVIHRLLGQISSRSQKADA